MEQTLLRKEEKKTKQIHHQIVLAVMKETKKKGKDGSCICVCTWM